MKNQDRFRTMLTAAGYSESTDGGLLSTAPVLAVQSLASQDFPENDHQATGPITKHRFDRMLGAATCPKVQAWLKAVPVRPPPGLEQPATSYVAHGMQQQHTAAKQGGDVATNKDLHTIRPCTKGTGSTKLDECCKKNMRESRRTSLIVSSQHVMGASSKASRVSLRGKKRIVNLKLNGQPVAPDQHATSAPSKASPVSSRGEKRIVNAKLSAQTAASNQHVASAPNKASPLSLRGKHRLGNVERLRL